jgi:hypothetical protein
MAVKWRRKKKRRKFTTQLVAASVNGKPNPVLA